MRAKTLAAALLALAAAGCEPAGGPETPTPPQTASPTPTGAAGTTLPTGSLPGGTDTPEAPSPTASPEASPTGAAAASPSEEASPTAAPEPTATPLPCDDGGPASPSQLEARFVAQIYPLMTRTTGGCLACHFDGAARPMTMGSDGPETFRRTWAQGFLADGPDTLLGRVSRTDPLSMPLGGPPWSADERRSLACFVGALEGVAPDPTPTPGDGPGCEDADPGRVTLHRLNRAEYDNTVRDLLGDDTRPARDFPVDDRGYGYDNIADVLTTAPLLVEKYALAARSLIDDTLGRRPAPVLHHYEAESWPGTGGGINSYGYEFGSNGSLTVPFVVEVSGRYRLSAMAFGDQAGDEPARMAFAFAGEDIATFDVPVEEGAAEIYAVEATLEEGAEGFTVAFINDFFNLRNPPGDRDRNLTVDWVAVEGPLDAQIPPSARRSALMSCEPEPGQEIACASEILGAFARRAWRRPLEGDELDRLLTLTQLALDEGDDFEAAIRIPLRAALLSPNFLFRVERDPDLGDPSPHRLGPYELASRLSYFLWSSAPDDALLAAADADALSEPGQVSAQVERMLADPRAEALVDNFAGQWLYTRAVAEAQPDPEAFPEFDDALRAAFAGETSSSFAAALTEDADPRQLLRSDEAFLNDRLAEHYGLPLPGSDALVRVPVEDPLRGGLLTQGTFHVVTSHATQTSPVLRGKWVLTQLLCQPPPPPPGNVDPIEVQPESDISQREELSEHVANPTCASCHEVMDPIGFGLENFDAVSRWRSEDDYGFPIDATGALPPERAFDGPEALIDLIVDDPAYPRCVARQLLTYAVGRGTSSADDCAVDAATRGAEEGPAGLRGIVHAITLSEPFLSRRADPEEAP